MRRPRRRAARVAAIGCRASRRTTRCPPTVAARSPTTPRSGRALVTGLRDYVRKNGFALGRARALRAASTRRWSRRSPSTPSAPTTCTASRCRAPTPPSTRKGDAADLAERTGCHLRTVPIAPMVDAFQAQLALTGLAEENLQARVRGVTLMAISNAEGHLVLATGNKSELAVGYSTIYGDAVGGFAPIKDVPKTDVWQLARWRNADAEAPRRDARRSRRTASRSRRRPSCARASSTTTRCPTTTCSTTCSTTTSRTTAAPPSSSRDGFDRALVERVLRLTDVAEYKRRQYPPGTKISLKGFGRDRRLPITNRWRETGALSDRGVRRSGRAPRTRRGSRRRRRPPRRPARGRDRSSGPEGCRRVDAMIRVVRSSTSVSAPQLAVVDASADDLAVAVTSRLDDRVVERAEHPRVVLRVREDAREELPDGVACCAHQPSTRLQQGVAHGSVGRSRAPGLLERGERSHHQVVLGREAPVDGGLADSGTAATSSTDRSGGADLREQVERRRHDRGVGPARRAGGPGPVPRRVRAHQDRRPRPCAPLPPERRAP